jgi:hypothetical protein
VTKPLLTCSALISLVISVSFPFQCSPLVLGCSCPSTAPSSSEPEHPLCVNRRIRTSHSLRASSHLSTEDIHARASMEVEHSGPVLRTRRNLQAPTKQVKPAAPKKSVSVAALFKQPAHRSSKASIAPQPTAKIPPLPVEDASDEKDQSLKSRSSSHSPHKEGRKVPTKQSDMHPLAVEFRGTCLSTIACKFK